MTQPQTQTPPEPTPEAPHPDPLLIRQQELQQELQQLNRQLGEMRMQKSLTEDMIQATSDQAQRCVGALNELARES